MYPNPWESGKIIGNPWENGGLPSGKLTLLWKITICYGKTHCEWPCSKAILNYKRVTQKKKKRVLDMFRK